MSNYKVEIIKSKNGLETLKVNKYLLHSKYDPLKEAKQIVEKNYTENYTHILFGYGCGYIADLLREKHNSAEGELLIIDPLLTEIRDQYQPEIGDHNIISEIDEKYIESRIRNSLKTNNVNLKLICSPNYEKLFPEKYKKLLKVVSNTLKINAVLRNTTNYFAESWQENYIRNLIHVARDKSLFELKQFFKSPVVIASGGPSLTKQLPLLKKIRGKVILIAAGSTVNTLIRYSIEPDFVISIDGGINNYNHFKDRIFTNSQLIYTVRNHYMIRKQFKTQAYAFIPSIDTGVQKHIKKLTGKHLPMLSGGTSVANYALMIGLYISSGKIALIGQDLAYTNNQSHAEYNKNFKMLTEQYKKERGMFLTEGYYGDEVLTDTQFLTMKKSFESIAETFNDSKRVYNCTEGGAKINGLRQISFEVFCNEMLYDDFEPLNPTSSDFPKGDLHKLRILLNKEVLTYNKLEKMLNKALKLLESNSEGIAFDNKVIKGLELVDKHLKNIFSEVSMSSIVDPITLDILDSYLPKQGESKKEEFERVYQQNKQLYGRLLEAGKLSKKFTLELIKDIEGIMKGEDKV